jgi:hypothetical protein
MRPDFFTTLLFKEPGRAWPRLLRYTRLQSCPGTFYTLDGHAAKAAFWISPIELAGLIYDYHPRQGNPSPVNGRNLKIAQKL